MTIIRTRFSPSPTGIIHLGNARAALFAALFAAKHAGIFILRIEDTDLARSHERYVEMLQADLHWLGIEWQEGPGTAGPYAPYYQSQRAQIYEKYYQILETKKRIYPCFCTDQELNLSRKNQLSRGQAPRYAGTCLKLSHAEIAQHIASGKKPAWRFKIPADIAIAFIDTVKGPQSFMSGDIGDFIVRRKNGTPPFLYCNAIDDATMNVSHVLRGEDHLANTPRQILLLQALELSVPHYGHLSLIVGEDGAPLSKRHGSFSLQEMQQQGYLPLAVMNYLARLGHATDLKTLASFERLAEQFSLDKLSCSPARFDPIQLMHWQKMAVQMLSQEALLRWLGEPLIISVPDIERVRFVQTIQSNIEFPTDAIKWAEIFYQDNLIYDDEAKKIIHEAGETFFSVAGLSIEQFGDDLACVLAYLKKKLNVNGKKLFMPLRIALTGRKDGPELAAIAKIMGKQKLIMRLSMAYDLAKNDNSFKEI